MHWDLCDFEYTLGFWVHIELITRWASASAEGCCLQYISHEVIIRSQRDISLPLTCHTSHIMLAADLCLMRAKWYNCIRKGFSYRRFWAMEFKLCQEMKRKMEQTLNPAPAVAVCESEMIRTTFLSLSNLLHLHQRPKNTCSQTTFVISAFYFFFSENILNAFRPWLTLSKNVTFTNISSGSWHLELSHRFFLTKEGEACVISLMVHICNFL